MYGLFTIPMSRAYIISASIFLGILFLFSTSPIFANYYKVPNKSDVHNAVCNNKHMLKTASTEIEYCAM